ncbi:unnamed protein product [Adineta steineri]|uniref:Uncharacterized protein n=1 Tax=Adineta steineri TaxID=433720 RepID=A0A815E1A5_9BILA|nr:unnamed protein product [Adineta steineri]CAF1307552.1 unnamed protein product [Adineta steineri]CAF1308640.1 unnamed protein product [Adineta steineri]
MAVSYGQYMGYLFGVGAAILVVISIAIYVIIWKYPNLFHKILRLMFHIEVYDPSEEGKKKKTDSLTTASDRATTSATTTLPEVQAFESPSSAMQTIDAATRSRAIEMQMPTVAAPEKYLDVYGKYIHANTFSNKFFLAIIIVTVLFTATIAFYQGIFLANMTVYPDEPCPSNFIQMDCYFGSEHTYFNCTQGQQTDSRFVNGSAMCFRWIFRDVSVNDVMTQFGACYGLLNAFLAIIQVVLRFLLYSFTKRLATENEDTTSNAIPTQTAETAVTSTSVEDQETKHRKAKYVYIHKYLLQANLLALHLVMFAAFIPIFIFIGKKVNTTVLTYLILATIVMMAMIALLWIVRIDVFENDFIKADPVQQSLSKAVGRLDQLKKAGSTIISYFPCGNNG